jgi:hypothetical protein
VEVEREGDSEIEMTGVEEKVREREGKIGVRVIDREKELEIEGEAERTIELEGVGERDLEEVELVGVVEREMEREMELEEERVTEGEMEIGDRKEAPQRPKSLLVLVPPPSRKLESPELASVINHHSGGLTETVKPQIGPKTDW